MNEGLMVMFSENSKVNEIGKKKEWLYFILSKEKKH